jgi:rhodanese-related sulfurtransferase
MRLVSRILGQSLGILALSALAAFAVNAVRPDGLPIAQAAKTSSAAAPSAVQLSPASGEISLKDAAMLFLSGRAVFLDARSQYEFGLGHIQGALSLPPRNFASDFQDVKPQLAGKDAVITYCDGAECTLSHSLAVHLQNAGVKNVYVLKNGWSLWTAEKLPVAKGSAVHATPGPKAAPAPKKSPAPQTGKAPQMSKDVAKAKGQEKLCTDCTD